MWLRPGDEVVAEQDDAEHLVGAVEQVDGFLRAAVAGLGEMAQAKAVRGHHRRFRHREEARHRQQDDQNAQQDGKRNVVQVQMRLRTTSATKRLPT